MSEQLPLYAKIQAYMREQMASGKWLPHAQIPAERAMAERFGVSRITAKNAILGLVSEGLLYRLRGKGTFVSEGAAAAASAQGMPVGSERLRSNVRADTERPDAPARRGDAPAAGGHGASRLIGLIMPWMEFKYAAKLISGIESELSRSGFHLAFKRIGESQREESTAVRDFISIPVEGLIMVATRGAYFHDEMLRLILDKFPLVFVEKYVSDYRANRVYCDTEKGGRLLGDYLADSGCRSIGFITYPTGYTEGIRERVFGLQSALVERGIPPISGRRYLTLPAHLIEQSEHGDPEAVPQEIMEFIRLNPDLDAVATADAQLTAFAGKALRALGRSGTTLVGFDEPGFVRDGIAPSAYIDQSPGEMGVKAASLVIGAVNGRSQVNREVVEPKLVRL